MYPGMDKSRESGNLSYLLHGTSLELRIERTLFATPRSTGVAWRMGCAWVALACLP